MADNYQQTDTIEYEDNGRKIRKESWFDPASGESWDTFNDVGSWAQPSEYKTYDDIRNTDTYDEPYNQMKAQKAQKAQKKNKKNKKSENYAMADEKPKGQQMEAQRAQASADPRVSTPTSYSLDNKGSADQQRNNALYDFSNPQFALQNALKDQGINPFGANPFLAKYMAAAPGLAQSFLQQNAQGGPGAGGPEASIDAGSMFKNFLQQAIGGGGPVNIFSTLANAAGGFSGAVGAARDYRQQMMDGANPDSLNYFAGALNNIIRDPQTAAGAYMSLFSPAMNRPLGQAFQQGTGASLSGSLGKFMSEYVDNPQSNSDIYSYLLGV